MPAVQRLCPTDRALSACDGMLLAPRPSADTHAFSGHLVLYHPSLEGGSVQERLGPEHTMWANSVLASGTATGVVVHTGRLVSPSSNPNPSPNPSPNRNPSPNPNPTPSPSPTPYPNPNQVLLFDIKINAQYPVTAPLGLGFGLGFEP